MYSALVALGRDLEGQGKLPPVGFYEYGQPIRWIVHLWPDRIYLEPAELLLPRPFCGRSSDIQAHPLADEAGYALGSSRQDDARNPTDPHAAAKHQAFRSLLGKLLASPLVGAVALREAVTWLEAALDQGCILADPRCGEVLSKHWVSFLPEEGPLAGQHLFGHADVLRFWAEELQERSYPAGRPRVGECALCGKVAPLAGKLPKVKLAATVPLHGLNQDAFVSHLAGPSAAKRAHLGICFACGETAARAFNYLTSSDRHHRLLVRHPKQRDSLANQVALFWVKAPAPVLVGEEELDLDALQAQLSVVLADDRPRDDTPVPTLAQLAGLLELPWRPAEARLRLNDYGFCLGILSPNVGRIALREWLAVSLADLRQHLHAFLTATRLVSPWGDPPQPQPLRAILQALASPNPNLTRLLLRTAYAAAPPPGDLRVLATERLCRLWLKEADLREREQDRRRRRRPGDKLWDDAWLQSLAATIKLSLYYGSEEAGTMTELNPGHTTPAYLCGRLLAILEEAQQVATWVKSHRRLDTTIVNRSYRGASTAPKATFGQLLGTASVAHLPDAGRDLNVQLEDVMSQLQSAGGFPPWLDLERQAEFALGFYHQRAEIRKARRARGAAEEVEEVADEASPDDAEGETA